MVLTCARMRARAHKTRSHTSRKTGEVQQLSLLYEPLNSTYCLLRVMNGLCSLPALPPASRRRSDNTRTFSPRSHLYKVCCAALSLCFVLQQPLHAGASPSGSGGGDGSAVLLPGSVPLNFIFLSSNHPSLLTSGSIPAVDIAVEMVAESGILGKYRLQYTEALDSQVRKNHKHLEVHS